MKALQDLENKDVGQETSEVVGFGLHDEQANLMISALEFGHTKAIELMIPINKTFMIDYEEPIDTLRLKNVLDKGFSRILCHSKNNKDDILGIIRIKQLIGVDVSQGKSIKQLGLPLSAPLVMKPNSTALELLREFRHGRSHMAFITEQADELTKHYKGAVSNIDLTTLSFTNKPHIMGIVTLEDVLENMINIEIMDEEDYALSKRTALRKNSDYYSILNVNSRKDYHSRVSKELYKRRT